MKKLLLAFLWAAAASGGAFAQKTFNDPLAEKRNVSGFHGIDVGTGISLVLTEGSTEEVAVSAATAEFRDKIVTKVENGILKIHYENKMGAVNKRKESKNLKAWVSYKMLDLLHASTGADVKIDGVVKSASLVINASTGALINGEVNVTTLKIDQNTGSKVTLSGRAGRIDVEGGTGSKFMGENLASSNCQVKVNTGARVSIFAEKELMVSASTGGTVKYKGDASIREIKTNTGGSVSKI
jgi:hypothetical protein